MKKFITIQVLFWSLFLSALFFDSPACTSLIITRQASKDGSVMVTYTCDGAFHPILEREASSDHTPGDSVEIKDYHDKVLGKVKQAAHTYAYVGMMNEHQLVIGETTFDGRQELVNPQGLLGYYDLIRLALQRAKTAQEAISVIVELADTYGYSSSGETFSIADKKEAWIMELIGQGPGKNGLLWVARMVPDGYIACHANKAVIGEFPMNDPGVCRYSKNVMSFAIEK